ncbi:phosphoribosyltransferase [Gordonia phage Vasanti]|uniref:Phosphoribosyltransferase n=1 Tax=Gordonia phage Vasanti TaxID=2502431 RepID=A0A411BVX9_9CAUD|nr:phosphoribosyltransferase [Gordonia phage Vasanti]QAY05767.1 phosphoribosyltransferase [Gordonia phage Vasanti]
MSSPTEQTRILVATAGGFLRNVIRETGVTCSICATPVYGGYVTCYRCSMNGAHADIVVPLSYAIQGRQSGTTMRHYKDDGSADVRRRLSAVVQRALFVGLVRHQRCIENIVGQQVNRRMAIPSSNGRRGVHPFIAIAQQMNAVAESPRLVPAEGDFGREVTASRFLVDPPDTRFDGEHVLILDDTWTTGSRTQSAALLLRRLGAAHVSVMTVARWVDPNWNQNASFIRTRLANDFDPDRCPVTGTSCPV